MVNIFEDMKDKVFEQKRTVEEFDEASMEGFFRRSLRHSYEKLFLEGHSTLGIPLIARYIDGITEETLPKEVSLMVKYF